MTPPMRRRHFLKKAKRKLRGRPLAMIGMLTKAEREQHPLMRS